MAKRKMGSRAGAGRSPGGGTDSGRRPTKAERKDQARREREEIHARMARTRRNRFVALGVAIVVAAAAIAFAATRPRVELPNPQDLLAQAATAANTAGCGAVKNVGPYRPASLDRAHIGAQGGPATMPSLSSYPSTPPASGPHNANPLGAGVYPSPPPIDQVIHSLEHGAVVVWYSPSAPREEVKRITDFFASSDNNDHVIVAPYDYTNLVSQGGNPNVPGRGGLLPGGTQMAVVSWHIVRYCNRPSLPVAFDFVAHYRFPPFSGQKYLGEAPEQGAPI